MKIAQLGTDSVLMAPITAATTARTSSNLDCTGANYATIRVVVGAEVNTNATNIPLSFKESDDTNASNFATFSSTTQRTLDNTAGAVATTHLDLRSRKRYLNVTVTPDTTTNGAVLTSVQATVYKNVISDSATMLGADVVIL
tara:strand:+ start:2221 stop:2646 length:426 start_codon:yes stop_codon:yes gene_type:complete